MKYYSGYNSPYIYALFHKDIESKVEEILRPLIDKDILFWHNDLIDKKELKKVDGAYSLIVFITKDFINTKEFHDVVNEATKENKQILTIFLEDVELDSWAHMQLDSAQYLNINNKDFNKKLLEASIFKDMKVTDKQKAFQRKSSMFAIGTPIVSAILIFCLIIYPLMIAPIVNQEDEFGIKGLSQEELDSITTITVVGNTIYKDASKANCWYVGGNKNDVACEIITNNERQVINHVERGTISDISDIAKLKNLKVLNLCVENISDISPLYTLENLEILRITCNPITSIEGIGQLSKLNSLYIGSSDITDLSPLNDLEHLNELLFDNTPVVTYPNTQTLEGINAIVTNDNENIPYLGTHNTSTYHLSINDSDGLITDFSFLKDISGFEGIEIIKFNINDLYPYIEGKYINKLEIKGGFTGSDNFKELSGLNVTSSLKVSCFYQNSLEGIESFTKISTLQLTNTQNIQDFYRLNNMKNLKVVYVESSMKDYVLSQLNDDVSFELIVEDNF